MSETQLNAPTRPEPFFVCEHKALDFLSTIAAPWGEDIEWIGNGQDLLAWLSKAELISAEDALFFRSQFESNELDNVATKARELREWFRAFVEAHAEQPLDADSLEELTRINAILANDDLFRQIELNNSDNAFSWRQNRRWHSAEDLLLPLAEVMGDLVCSADFSYVKNCEGPTCTLYFHDVSKNRKRRWCTMSVCGNRAKAAAHRARNKRTQ